MKLELHDYQKDIVEFSLRNPYCIIALEMGMGKSPIFISLKDRLPNERFLVVCPSFLMFNWVKEINKFLDGQKITVFKKHKEVYYPFDSDFVITSYDIAIQHECLFEWATVIGFDEATAIKNMNAKRTEAIHKMVYENSTKRVCLLTGTPVKNRIQELYSLVALCNYNPSAPNGQFLSRYTNEIEFADKFSHRIEYDKWMYDKKRGDMRLIKITKWEGLKNKEELQKWLTGIYISKKSDMPPISYKDVFVDNFNDKELLAEFLKFREGHSGVSPQIKVKAALKKAPLTCRYVDDLLEYWESPIIVYTDHVEPCKAMAEHFKVEAITGQMSPINRQKMADKFQNGEIPVMVATYGSFAHGYTLTASNLIVENDYPWEPGTLKQADFRINRKGQTKPCHVHRILGSEQDEYILNTVLEKEAVAKAVY